MLPKHERDTKAGLRSLLIDNSFCDDLSNYKKDKDKVSESVQKKIEDFISVDIDVIHGHPEPLLDKKVLDIFGNENWQQKHTMIFVDEVHLAVGWGKDFRLKYKNVYEIRDSLASSLVGSPPIIAASATCPETMKKTIVKMFNMVQSRSDGIQMSPNRSNIFIKVRRSSKASNPPFDMNSVERPRVVILNQELAPILNEIRNGECDKTIIFVGRRNLCGEVFQLILTEVGDSVPPGFVVQFHRDLSRDMKQLACRYINAGVTQLVVATEAAGTGADFPGFSRIIHLGAPKSMLTPFLRRQKISKV